MINAITLAHIRTQRGLSQRKLAALVGLNYQVIRRLELGGDDGNLTLRDLAKICDALALAPARLLTSSSSAQGTAPHPLEASKELDLGQARLLRKIQTTPEAAKYLTASERQAVLPTLLKGCLVQAAHGQLRLTRAAASDLPHPDLLE